MSYVFDCYKLEGTTCVVPTFMASLVCDVLGWVTGRYFDHAPFHQEFEE